MHIQLQLIAITQKCNLIYEIKDYIQGGERQDERFFHDWGQDKILANMVNARHT